MVQNIAISNRPLSVVLNMTDSNYFLVVWAIWMRPKHARYLTVRTDFALFRLGSHQLLGYQESTFPFSIVQNLSIPNRPIALVHNMTNSQCSLMVSAEWLRSKDGRYFTTRSTASITIWLVLKVSQNSFFGKRLLRAFASQQTPRSSVPQDHLQTSFHRICCVDEA